LTFINIGETCFVDKNEASCLKVATGEFEGRAGEFRGSTVEFAGYTGDFSFSTVEFTGYTVEFFNFIVDSDRARLRSLM